VGFSRVAGFREVGDGSLEMARTFGAISGFQSSTGLQRVGSDFLVFFGVRETVHYMGVLRKKCVPTQVGFLRSVYAFQICKGR